MKSVDDVYFALVFVILSALMFGAWQHSVLAGFFIFSTLMIVIIIVGLRER